MGTILTQLTTVFTFMGRELAEGIYWIQECYNSPALRDQYLADPPGWYEKSQDIHVSDNAYLIKGEDTLLFDTLSPDSTDQILNELNEQLDGQSLDYIAPSHPENPHAGNTHHIMNEYPDAEVLAPASGKKHELYHLKNATKVSSGESLDLGGRTVEFVEPTFLDHRIHTWLFDLMTKTLFTVDWLGDVHMEKNCLSFLEELNDDDPVERQVEFHSRALFWFQFADREKMRNNINRIIDRHEPDILAPAHGFPVREDAIEYLRLNNEVVDTIRERGRIMSAY